MAKKNKTSLNTPSTAAPLPPDTGIPDATTSIDHPLLNLLSGFKVQAVITILLSLLLYSNTIQNEYALDDYMVIVKNKYVYQGMAGLPGIFTKDTYASYWEQINGQNQLTGGRYRPLSVATFAIEQQFFGAVPASKIDSVMQHSDWGELKARNDDTFLHQMHIRHFFNVLWFTLSVVVLLYFLRNIVFRQSPLMALVAILLFVAHPIHTEVVANVKSRDEILSLLFISLTFIFAFKHQEQKDKKAWLYLGMGSLFLAFLSKEYAISLVLLLPLSLILFKKYSLSQSITASLPYWGITLLYAIIRMSIIAPAAAGVPDDIVTNPYALATATEQLATKIATTLDYLKLLIFPYPLSADYSYNSIPYKDFSSLLVWLSLAVHIGLIRAFFYCLKRYPIMAFAIAFYFVNLLLVNNLFFNIGGTMGERLIYHSSVGFCIAAAWLFIKSLEVIPQTTGKSAMAGGLVVCLALLGFRTIDRNKDWKNDGVLFSEDVKVVPNSVLVNANLAAHLVSISDNEKDPKTKKEDLIKAISLLDNVIGLHDADPTNYFNKCIAYSKLNNPDSAYHTLNILHKKFPTYPNLIDLYFQTGKLFLANKNYSRAKFIFQDILKASPGSAPVQQLLNEANDSLGIR